MIIRNHMDFYISSLCLAWLGCRREWESTYIRKAEYAKYPVFVNIYLGVAIQLFFQRKHRLNITEAIVTVKAVGQKWQISFQDRYLTYDLWVIWK